ncbi:MAG: hypothetical protein ABJQ34_19200 [Paracoccaceae bacterium]
MEHRITLKFIKSTPQSGPAVRLRASGDVIEDKDPDYTVDNSLETILCLRVPHDKTHNVQFDVLSPVRRVVLQGDDIAFICVDNVLSLKTPATKCAMDRTADMHMIVPFDGVDFRLEVPNQHQKAGKYANTSYPTKARHAATIVEFAMLEAVQQLGLDKTVGQGPCGPVYVMGFDTNNPCGHTDWPPHVHLHMAHPAVGAPIGHYYFDEDLRFLHNDLYLRGSDVPTGRFDRNMPCPHFAPDETLLFDMMITSDGGLRLTCANGEVARISPLGGGFDTGAILEIGTDQIEIKVAPDSPAGVVSVEIADARFIYTFDPDTGKFLSLNTPVATSSPLVDAS